MSRLPLSTKRRVRSRVIIHFIDSNFLTTFSARPSQSIDKPVFQVRAQPCIPSPARQMLWEVARAIAAMDVFPGLVVLLAAPDHELVFLNGLHRFVAG